MFADDKNYQEMLKKMLPGGFESLGAATEMDCKNETRKDAMMIVAGCRILSQFEQTQGFAVACALDESFQRLYREGAVKFIECLVSGGFPKVLEKDANGKMPLDHALTVVESDLRNIARNLPPETPNNGNPPL